MSDGYIDNINLNGTSLDLYAKGLSNNGDVHVYNFDTTIKSGTSTNTYKNSIIFLDALGLGFIQCEGAEKNTGINLTEAFSSDNKTRNLNQYWYGTAGTSNGYGGTAKLGTDKFFTVTCNNDNLKLATMSAFLAFTYTISSTQA